jgi:long-chain acyl-CoA synthetase
MEVKIDSDSPDVKAGEILVSGMNVMKGYYKNEISTNETLQSDGWMRTGDLGIIDSEGNITILGRSKNMILGPNGQNIYPEEIEDKINSMPYVAESIVIQKNGKLVALIHPDYNEVMTNGLTSADVERIMDENRQALNTLIPKYSQIASVKIYSEEFEKTPKRSIKRYLYT